MWSLLRAVCDPYADGTDITAEHCETTANDSRGDDFGTQGIIKAVQSDIDAGNSPPDFLPFQDIQYYRAHYNFIAGSGAWEPLDAIDFIHRSGRSERGRKWL